MPSAFSWLSICFFGLGYPFALFNLLDRRPQIIVNELGVFDRMSNTAFINWHLIDDAYLLTVHRQKFVCLIIHDDAIQHLKNKTSARLSKKLGFQELNLSLGQVEVDEMRFLDFILAMSKAKSTDRGRLLKKYTNK